MESGLSFEAGTEETQMNRRHFLLSAASAPLFAQTMPNPKARQYYELRWFYLRNGSHAPRMFQLLEKWSAAAKQAHIEPVGFFQPVIGEEGPSVLMISAYESPDAAAGAFDRLMQDDSFAAAYGQANAPEPAFTRMESSLLRAFTGFPTLQIPKQREGNAPHLFEIRTYQSNSMISLRTKLQMFNGGEIAIFERLGMSPIFFGESVFGGKQPNLTYMLAYDDLTAREKLWRDFVADPEFTKLRNKPGYSDAEIVSSISNSLVRPLAFSQIR
jgi:hypothetical protein